jgi:hypothetical protein
MGRGLESKRVSAGLSNNPSRSDREDSVSLAASVAICFGFDLFVSENPGRGRAWPCGREAAGRLPPNLLSLFFGGEAVEGVAML